MTDDYFDSIPSHLKIKYEVINDQGKMIDLNEDLDLLKKENKKNVEAVVERIQFNIEQAGITSWPIDELPIKVEQTINGKKILRPIQHLLIIIIRYPSKCLITLNVQSNIIFKGSKG